MKSLQLTNQAKSGAIAMLIIAALLLCGGAFRREADVLRAGLLLLAFGAIALQTAIRKSVPLTVAFGVLAVTGVFYALTT
jgi:hypothetical protein